MPIGGYGEDHTVHRLLAPAFQSVQDIDLIELCGAVALFDAQVLVVQGKPDGGHGHLGRFHE